MYIVLKLLRYTTLHVYQNTVFHSDFMHESSAECVIGIQSMYCYICKPSYFLTANPALNCEHLITNVNLKQKMSNRALTFIFMLNLIQN